MKNTAIIILSIMLTGLFGSCSDMLNIDSDRVVLVDENKLNSANDSLYSIAGILNLWQAYGEQYVLLGELRGDLMDVTDNTSIELREIANFTATADNPYVSRRAAYAVIQNCNYVIKNLDTTVVVNSQRLMKREYAVAKVYRAWMYLQLGLNYGKAVYITEPILSLEAAEKDYPEYDLPQLIDALIADLAPVEEIELTMGFPTYGRIGSRNLQDSFIPVDMLLGDLYLWKASLTGDRSAYEMAAQKYYSLMNLQQYGYTVPRYSTEWGNTLYTSLIMYNSGWNGIFSGSNNEVITAMTCAAKYGLLYKTLPNLATQPKYTYEVAPSQVAMQNWKNQVYYLETNRNDTIPGVYNTIDGDFRGYVSWGMNTISSSYRQYEINPGDTIPLIYKYSLSQSTISGSVGDDGEETDDEEAEEELNLIYYDVFLYRVATLYLHYAEALNNLGYPSTAFAVLKYGMNNQTFVDSAAIAAHEKANLPAYCNFTDPRFESNTAIRARTLGNVDLDTLYYVIPPLATAEDSIRFVDEKICEELGLETAFEGNRFHDLMRFAKRFNEPAYLANKVGAKNPTVKDLLMNEENWYLKYRK
jgi:hypothetical protein